VSAYNLSNRAEMRRTDAFDDILVSGKALFIDDPLSAAIEPAVHEGIAPDQGEAGLEDTSDSFKNWQVGLPKM
jgi:hypothetical protein